MKPISTFTHGLTDYAASLVMMVLPVLMGLAGAAQTLMLTAGVAMLGLAMMTRYELGLVKLIPMTVHLGIDFVLGALLALTPLLFITLETPAETSVFVLLGLAEMAASLLTMPYSSASDMPLGGAS